MALFGWTLIGVSLAYVNWIFLRWLAFNTRLPLGWSDGQRARDVMRRGARWDVSDAVERGTR